MTLRSTALVALVALALVASGCIGAPGSDTTTAPGASPSPGGTGGSPPTDDAGTPAGTTPDGNGTDAASPVDVTDYESHVFDHGGLGSSVIEGGLSHGVDSPAGERLYVTAVSTDAEAERFNHSVLGTSASAFVRNTSFEAASLVVVQSFPASSFPDYRVESVTREGGHLDVAINDSSRGGTDDVTVETLLLRVPGDPPESVTVTTEEGETVEWPADSGSGESTGTRTVTGT